MLEEAQEVLRQVAQYTEPANHVQRVCDHPAQIIALQKQITDLQAQQFLPVQWIQTERANPVRGLENELGEARTRPVVEGMNTQPCDDHLAMTHNAQQSGEEVRGSRMQFANALTLGARVAPMAPQTHKDTGQKFPDSLDFSGSDRTQMTGWIAQLRMVIQHKPASFPDKQSKMR